MKTNKVLYRCIVIVFFILGISDNVMGENPMHNPMPSAIAIQNISQQKWDNLAEKKIFFGHQSVGYNIIIGIEQIIKEYPNIRVKILKTRNITEFNNPVFAHDWIGSNMDPASKMRDFTDIMTSGVGQKVNIAFMKLCYVDVTATTNVQQVFEDYKKTLENLTNRFPDVTFVIVTVPLTAQPEGMNAVKQSGKNIIKKIMGKPVFNYRDNVNRNKFNQMLRVEYTGKRPLFDLASFEAVDPSDVPSFFIKNEEKIMTLASQYTSDGGHLNAEGRKQIAEQLLIFLADLK